MAWTLDKCKEYVRYGFLFVFVFVFSLPTTGAQSPGRAMTSAQCAKAVLIPNR